MDTVTQGTRSARRSQGSSRGFRRVLTALLGVALLASGLVAAPAASAGTGLGPGPVDAGSGSLDWGYVKGAPWWTTYQFFGVAGTPGTPATTAPDGDWLFPVATGEFSPLTGGTVAFDGDLRITHLFGANVLTEDLSISIEGESATISGTITNGTNPPVEVDIAAVDLSGDGVYVVDPETHTVTITGAPATVATAAFTSAFGGTVNSLGVGTFLSPVTLSFAYTPPDTTVTDGILGWNVKNSLQNYVGEYGNNSITATVPATKNGSGIPYRFDYPVTEGDFDPATGFTDVRFGGSAVFDFPGHCFKMTVGEPHVVITLDEATLYADIDVELYPDCDALGHLAGGGDDVPAFTLDISDIDPVVDGGITTWTDVPVLLTSAGSEFFAGFYSVGTAFQPITFSYTGPGGKPIPSEVPLVASGTEAYGLSDLNYQFSAYGDGTFDFNHGFAYNPVDGLLYYHHERYQDGGGGQPFYQLRTVDPETMTVQDEVTPSEGALNGLQVSPQGIVWSLSAIRGTTTYRNAAGQLVVVDSTAGGPFGTALALPDGNVLKWSATGSGSEVQTVFSLLQVNGQPWAGSGNYQTLLDPELTGVALESIAVLPDGTLVAAGEGPDGLWSVGILELTAGSPDDIATFTPVGGLTGLPEQIVTAGGADRFLTLDRFTRTDDGETVVTGRWVTRSGGTWVAGAAFDILDASSIPGEALGLRQFANAVADDAGTAYVLTLAGPLNQLRLTVVRGQQVLDQLVMVRGGTTDPHNYHLATDGTRVWLKNGYTIRQVVVDVAASITGQPQDTAVDLAVGQTEATLTLTSAASGASPVATVRWQRLGRGATRWLDIPGATGPTLVTLVDSDDEGTQYRALYSNRVGTVATRAATLTFQQPPSITTQPQDVVAPAGEPATFAVGTAGLPEPAVQWQRLVAGEWTDIDGATGNTLSLAAATEADSGSQFRARVSNSGGTVYSDPATLTVGEGSAPDTGDQTIVATVPASSGAFSWTIDGSGPVTLTEAVNQGSYLEATGVIHPVTVSDTRSSGPVWSISGQVSDFTNGLDGKYLGWDPQVLTEGAGAEAGDPVPPGITTGDGLTAGAILGSAPAGHLSGSASLGADLLLQVPATTDPGTYTTTLTLTALQ